MATEFPIEVEAGRDFYLNCAMQTGLKNPANCTGFQLKMTVKKVQTDSDANALFQGTPIVGADLAFGKFSFHMTPAQTNPFWVNGAPVTDTIVYDVSTLDIANPPNFVTLIEGPVSVVGPVTEAIP